LFYQCFRPQRKGLKFGYENLSQTELLYCDTRAQKLLALYFEIQKMGAASRVLPYYTVKDWEDWEGRWELIEGFPYAKHPSPRIKHQTICGIIFGLLSSQLKHCGHCNVNQSIDWQISDDTVISPDIVVYCENAEIRLILPPFLVLEILSPSTANYDRINKFQLCQKAGVQYFILVNPEKEQVEIWELADGKYHEKTIDPIFIFSPEADCSVQIIWAEIWS